jgi:hypothetical protein
MLEVAVLSFVLSQQPIRGNTSEKEKRFSFHSTINRTIEQKPQFKAISLSGNASTRNASIKEFSTVPEVSYSPAEIVNKFRQLAIEWSENTGHISSTSDLISNPSYQEIIGLGWGVVPLLLKDLQESKRFWFPALYAITGVRPFDPSDAGNGRRMTEAWIKWGKRKGLV